MKNLLLLCILLVNLPGLHAQTVQPPRGKLFDDSYVKRIEITIDTISLIKLIALQAPKEEQAATAVFHYKNHSDTLKNIGLKLKGNTSLGNKKKSFRLSFNAFQKGKKYQGVEKLNLNANGNDPTQIRAHLATKVYEHAELAISRSAFADLYINNAYFGLYNIFEHIDEEFVKSHFGSKKGNLYKCRDKANLAFISNDTNAYKKELYGTRIYELKTNKAQDDYSGLAEFIDILNNTPIDDLECKLSQRFNVSNYLKYMAIDVLIGNWDGYVFSSNNYYLFDNPLSGKFEFLPYDFDNTFGIDFFGEDWANKDVYSWSNKDFLKSKADSLQLSPDEKNMLDMMMQFMLTDMERPLYERLLEVESFRNQYNYHLNNLTTHFLNSDTLGKEIDRLVTMLKPSLQKDTFDNFTWPEIEQAVNESIDAEMYIGPIKQKYLPYGVKNYIDSINASINRQVDTIQTQVIFSYVSVAERYHNIFIDIQTDGHSPDKVTAYIKEGKNNYNPLKVYRITREPRETNKYVYSLRLEEKMAKNILYFIEAELDGKIFRYPCEGVLNK
jgi:spore coat protein H